jgi:hypothetical protein
LSITLDIQNDREKEGGRERERLIIILTDRLMVEHMDGQMDEQTYRCTDRLTVKQADE